MKSFNFKGLDEIDIIRIINSKKNAYLKLLLEALEKENLEFDKYKEIRKAILDSFNEYTRSILRLFTDDIEK